MKKFLSLAIAMAMLLSATSAFADQNNNNSKEKKLEDYATMGTGVYNVKTNDKGEITSLIVVGTSRVSTVLGASKGKETARRRASMVCDAAFAQWCKESLEVKETTDDEEVIGMKGVENGDDEQLAEEGKATEVTTSKITSYAKQTLRGMQVIYSKLDADGKEYVIIKGLDMKKVKAVKDVAKELNDDEQKEEESLIDDADDEKDATDTEDAKSGKNPNKGKLKSEKHVAPEADEFL